jgi:predicted RND superfamily exporter protein
MNLSEQVEAMPAIGDVRQFDRRSGNALERLVFNNRVLFILLCVVATVLLGYQISKLVVNANFDKVIPHNHPYIKNYFDNRDKLGGVGNAVRVVVENPNGEIFDPKFLEITQQINKELFLTPGTDRTWMRSIWMASVRWSEVTEEGVRGGTVMPENYDGSPESIETLKRNLNAAGVAGSLVGTDYRSLMFVVPLLDKNPDTGLPFDYGAFSRHLEDQVRAKFADKGVNVHIVGFAKLVGDLIDGLRQVMVYFGIAALVAAGIIFAYTRCLRSTALVVACSLIAVVWQVGLISALGYELDPYSILVPFLVFAIGVSHGAQKMNGIMQDVGRGAHKYVAARYTFRRLFLAGLTALLADAVGFAVLVVIDVPVIKDLAVSASIGVAVLIFTNLLLLPVALSYVGVSREAASRSLSGEERHSRGIWAALASLTERKWAVATLAGALAMTAGGVLVALKLKVGDLDPGAPELRPDSRYNQDVAYINAHFTLSSDQFVVMVKTPPGGCEKYETLKETERLGAELQQLPGVRQTFSLADNVRKVVAGLNEGNPKWMTISRSQALLGGAVNWVTTDSPDMVDRACSVIPVVAYLTDHKAETLDRVVATVERFAREHDDKELSFLLATGSAGIEAVTNIVVRDSILKMYAAVYSAVALLCFITFRSWRAVIVAIVPLVMTSILCKTLMVWLGIGLKVATLPVIALGVGIGVDYALYLLSLQLAQQRQGLSLAQAYRNAIGFTGKVVALVAVTLAAGVVTWAWSPIKFQADMGILLTFMLLWNMVGALVLIPALSHFLLPGDESRQKQAAGAAVTSSRTGETIAAKRTAAVNP